MLVIPRTSDTFDFKIYPFHVCQVSKALMTPLQLNGLVSGTSILEAHFPSFECSRICKQFYNFESRWLS
jgi:predicted thioredoxin/glutaredoxin